MQTESSTRLFVGNIPWSTTEDDLRALFAPLGQISFLSIPTGRQSRSRGYGIVEFTHEAEAMHAVAQLNGTQLGDRAITVREDKVGPRGPASNGGGKAPAGNSSGTALADTPAVEGCRCYLGNLSWETSSEDLYAHCQQAGVVINGEVATQSSGRSKGWGLVDFGSPQDAANAVAQLHNTELHGRSIIVRLERPGGAGGGPKSTGRANTNNVPAVQRTGTSSGLQCVVRNLPWTTTSEDLREVFQQVGNVVHAETVRHDDTGRSKGWGTVRFETAEQAQAAIDGFNGIELVGRPMQVKLDRYA